MVLGRLNCPLDMHTWYEFVVRGISLMLFPNCQKVQLSNVDILSGDQIYVALIVSYVFIQFLSIWGLNIHCALFIF